MAAYLGYALRMKTLFVAWFMTRMYTRKRRRWQKVMSEAGTSSGANARRPNAGIHLGLPD